ncbi:hypothetical protein Tco_0773406 [Tanacetum coccineum]|uniref:Uncharacterized protein n=1 Tax=Tanacetum coccineum TaxID=301880 RepID=A0ABQ4ZLK6_9ASTR
MKQFLLYVFVPPGKCCGGSSFSVVVPPGSVVVPPGSVVVPPGSVVVPPGSVVVPPGSVVVPPGSVVVPPGSVVVTTGSVVVTTGSVVVPPGSVVFSCRVVVPPVLVVVLQAVLWLLLLIIADLMKKFPNIPKRIKEDYHSIKNDVPLVSVYTTRNVLVQGMLIPDAFLTAEIRETNDFKEYETVFMKEIVDAEKNDVDFEDRLEPGSHKENLEVVVDNDDDDDNARAKKDDEMGSLEIRNEETQTTISTPIRSPRKSLSLDKNIFQELTNTVSIPITITAKHSQVKKRISSKYSYLLEIAENAVNDLIEYNLKPCIAETIIEDRDAFRSDIPSFVYQEFKTHAPKIITELFKDYVQSNVIHVHPTIISSTLTDSSTDLQYQLYLKMKRSLQDRANNITLWEALRRKFEKSSTSNTSCRGDDFHSHHDEHQDDDAPPEGEKRVKMSKKSKRSKSTRGSSSKHSIKDSTTYVSKQQIQHQEWDAWEEENVVDEDEVIPEDVTPLS